MLSYADLFIFVFLAFVLLYAIDAMMQKFSSNNTDEDTDPHYGEFTEADVDRLQLFKPV